MVNNDFYRTLDLQLLEINNYNALQWKREGLEKFDGKEGFEEYLSLLRFLTHPQIFHLSILQVEKIAKRAVIDYPARPDFYCYLVQALYYSQEGQNAAELLTKNLIEQHPGNEHFALLRACYLLATNFSSSEEGLSVLENFLTKNGKYVSILKELALRYETLDLIKARFYYSRLLEIQNNNAIWNYKLALVLFQLRNFSELEAVLQLLDTIIESEPNFLPARELKVDVLWYAQRYTEAITVTQDILHRLPYVVRYAYESFYFHPYLKRPIGIISAEELEVYHQANLKCLQQQVPFIDKDEILEDTIWTAQDADMWEEFCEQHNFYHRFNSLTPNLRLTFVDKCIKELLLIVSDWFDKNAPDGLLLVNRGFQFFDQKLQSKKVLKKNIQLYYEELLAFQYHLSSIPLWINSFLDAVNSATAYLGYPNNSNGLTEATNKSFWSYAYAELYKNEYTRIRLTTGAERILVRKLDSVQKNLQEKLLLLSQLEETGK
jgi:hypothetical protein